MTQLQTRAEQAAVRASAQAKKDAAKRRREDEKKMKPLAAKRLSEVVGRKVAMKAIEVKGFGSDRNGATMIFDYDGVEFEYGNYGGLHFRRPCPDCGETISKSAHGLAEMGRFLAQTRFESYEHSCFKTAVKSLQLTAESHAKKQNASAYDLLQLAADSYLGRVTL